MQQAAGAQGQEQISSVSAEPAAADVGEAHDGVPGMNPLARVRCLSAIGGLVPVAGPIFLGAPFGEALEILPGFVEKLRSDGYAQASAPTEVPCLKWDFSGRSIWVYDLHGESRMGGGMDRPGTIRTEATMEGQLVVRSLGDGTGELVISDIRNRQEFTRPETGSTETMETVEGPVVLQGVTEDGSNLVPSVGGFGERIGFPLPTRPLGIGESIRLPVSKAFPAGGSLLIVRGYSEVTLNRYVRIGRRLCAELEAETDVSDLRVPPELEPGYDYSMIARAVYYFDPAARCLVRGASAAAARTAWPSRPLSAESPHQPAEDSDAVHRDALTLHSLVSIGLREDGIMAAESPAAEAGEVKNEE